jgi:hypothetical protein
VKKALYTIIFIVSISILVFLGGRNKTEAPLVNQMDTRNAMNQQQIPETFTGMYQDYNTGCFSDGTCAAIIDGKTVITIIGWSRDTSGIFEDPDLPFGTQVEVFANKIDENTYTLYGSEDYYIKEIKN